MDDERDKDRDHYDRPSWKEIDNRKDKSKHVTDERQSRRKPRQVATAYSQYKDQLDQLFDTGEKASMVKGMLQASQSKAVLDQGEAPERQKLLRAIREAPGERGVQEAVDAFIARYGELPEDVDVLTQALLHADDEVKAQALCKIGRHLDGHILQQKALLLERVKAIIRSGEDDDVVELAKEVRRKLGV